MGILNKLLGKKKKSQLPPDLESLFKSMSGESAFSVLRKQMGVDNQKILADGPSNPNYGLSASNPAFVEGIMGTDLYLARLRTPSGETLKWERFGSTQAEGIPGNTDIYTGFLEDGSSFITIFVNWYGKSNSTVAPKGLKRE